MVNLEFDDDFKKVFSKIKDPVLKEKIVKLFVKIKENPEIGKPMMFSRKGSRELYISPFRLSYAYIKEEDLVIILDLYHKDEQ